MVCFSKRSPRLLVVLIMYSEDSSLSSDSFIISVLNTPRLLMIEGLPSFVMIKFSEVLESITCFLCFISREDFKVFILFISPLIIVLFGVEKSRTPDSLSV